MSPVLGAVPRLAQPRRLTRQAGLGPAQTTRHRPRGPLRGRRAGQCRVFPGLCRLVASPPAVFPGGSCMSWAYQSVLIHSFTHARASLGALRTNQLLQRTSGHPVRLLLLAVHRPLVGGGGSAVRARPAGFGPARPRSGRCMPGIVGQFIRVGAAAVSNGVTQSKAASRGLLSTKSAAS